MKHTEGTWHIGREADHSVDRFKKNCEWSMIRNEQGGLIAKIESVHPKGKRQSSDFDIEAGNAALIAAAPDMLEACKAVLDIVNAYSHIPAQLKACEILQEAIAKAGIGR